MGMGQEARVRWSTPGMAGRVLTILFLNIV